jgi:hypothetical protein
MLRLDLQLPSTDPALSVEQYVQAHLTRRGGPVHYVENSLINSLFGLLCWPAIFAPLPGAFFHPFQRGPVDLLNEDFHERRADLFRACLKNSTMAVIGKLSAIVLSKNGACSRRSYSGACSTKQLLEQAWICLPARAPQALVQPTCCWTSRPIAPACRT